MNLLYLDEDFEVLGAVGLFRSLIWRRKYYEVGEFELHIPSKLFSELSKARYLYRNDAPELGVIEKCRIKRGTDLECFVAGRFAESLLSNRAILRSDETDNIERIMRKWVVENAIVPADTGRVIPRISLGALSNIGTTISVQRTGKDLSEELYALGKTQEISHRLRYDYEGNGLKFEVWRGLDRTDTQSVNSWAIFADEFRNILQNAYDYSDADHKNYAYVAGEGEGSARKIVQVDVRTDPRDERRELFVDARDLQKDYTDEQGRQHTYTDAEYTEILRQRGYEKLSQKMIVQTLAASVSTSGNIIYGEDFDLGDKVIFRNSDAGIEVSTRIEQVNEVIEGAAKTVNIEFGNGYASSIKQIIRRETA